MKRIRQWFSNFFFPPAGSPTWKRVLPYASMGVLTLLVLFALAVGWEYTNSPSFCGTSCHTMPPEYTAYLVSPHARVDCVDCHIGRGFIATRITRKAGDLKHVLYTLFQSYEFPIRAGEMRPARETCEKCHFPEKFSDDSLREIQQYRSDLENTPESIYLVLKTGGGSSRQGLGLGIHWHIENPVYYYATDDLDQEIPYVRVENEDGSFTEYVDIESGFDPATINPEELEQMDCITCHNRITHLVFHPEDSIDKLLSTGAISTDIPEIRRIAVEAFYRDYPNKVTALAAIAAFASYYQVNYPEYYAENQAEVDEAISALQHTYDMSVYPEQQSDWNTHFNNIGHLYSPGCFRCHDGQHLNEDQHAVRLECNLCHSIPVVAGTEDFVTNIEISRGPQPQTHANPNWISLHNQAFDPTCSACHTTEDAGGVSNTSFCSNSACHGSAWTYAGFDAPALREVLLAQLPPTPTPTAVPTEVGATPLPPGESTPTSQPPALNFTETVQAIFTARCGACHGATAMQDLNLTEYAALMEGGSSGAAIIPGDAENSLLVQKQSGEQAHFGQLTPAELQTVVEWINAGAPE